MGVLLGEKVGTKRGNTDGFSGVNGDGKLKVSFIGEIMGAVSEDEKGSYNGI